MPYILNKSPFLVPTNDGKEIKEYVGLASTKTDGFSIAHMVAPPGWSEPAQQPEFDEITIITSGRKQFEIDGEVLVLEAGECVTVLAGSRVLYANPFEVATTYWSICMPAFSLARVHRQTD